MRHPYFAAGLLGMCALAGGCTVGDTATAPPGSLQTVTSNSLSLNGLRTYQFSMTTFATQPMGKQTLNGLDPGHLTLNDLGSDGLEHSPEGRQVLEYLSKCALTEDTVLVADSEGVEYEFPGHLGLAPEWAQGTCDETCQRWVSACLLAHINPDGNHVTISVRGPHPRLQADDAESAQFGFEEAAFFGNLFASQSSVYLRREAFACMGLSVTSDFFAAKSLAERACGTSGVQCDLNDLGICFSWSGIDGATCEGDPGSGAGYNLCRGRFLQSNGFYATVEYAEVITTFLKNDPVF